MKTTSPLSIVTIFMFFGGAINAVQALFLDKIIGPSSYLESACAGSCKLCPTCWMTGGVVTNHCGGIYFCCEVPPAAEARKINFLSGFNEFDETFGNAINADPDELQDIKYGPVVNSPFCGRPQIGRRRVVGGWDAGFGRFPWQALIRFGNSRCGGALVDNQHVVTAGHCVHSADARTVRVFLGEYSLRRRVEPLPRQEFGVEEIHMHPYYRFTPQADRFDVAVLRLDRRVRFMPHILPVCLPEKGEELPEGTEAMVTGWGAMEVNAKERPTDLQAVDVKLVNATRCEGWHESNGIRVRKADALQQQCT